MPNIPPDQKNSLPDILILSAIIAVGLILIILGTSKYGVGLTGDSISYIALANNILKNFSFTDISGEPFVLWPPGYSLVLAGFSLPVGGDVYSVLLPVNLIFYIATVICLWLLLKPRLYSRIFTYLVLATAALSPAVIRIFSFAFAEVPFIPLLLLFFLFIERINGKNGIVFISAAGVVVVLLSLLKYTGIVLLPILLWAIFTCIDGKKRIKALILSGMLVPLPLIWVVVLNFIRSGTLTGYRGGSASSLLLLMVEAGGTLLYWVFPVIVVLVVLIGMSKKWTENGEAFSEGCRANKFLLVSSGLYFLVILMMSLVEAVDDMNNRLMIPLYFTLLIPAAFYVEKILVSVVQNRWRVVIVVLLFLVPLAYARTNYRGVTARFEHGVGGISSDEFHSKFPKDIENLKRIATGKRLYTNNPAVFYYLTGLQNKTIPRKKYYNSEEAATHIDGLTGYFEGAGDGYILIMSDFISNEHYKIEEVGKLCNILETFRGSGWAMYRVGSCCRK